METITLSYNPRSAVALSMLAAIQELEAGRGTRAKDSNDLFKQILGY